jgi:hypothetical protein
MKKVLCGWRFSVMLFRTWEREKTPPEAVRPDAAEEEEDIGGGGVGGKGEGERRRTWRRASCAFR